MSNGNDVFFTTNMPIFFTYIFDTFKSSGQNDSIVKSFCLLRETGSVFLPGICSFYPLPSPIYICNNTIYLLQYYIFVLSISIYKTATLSGYTT